MKYRTPSGANNTAETDCITMVQWVVGIGYIWAGWGREHLMEGAHNKNWPRTQGLLVPDNSFDMEFPEMCKCKALNAFAFEPGTGKKKYSWIWLQISNKCWFWLCSSCAGFSTNIGGPRSEHTQRILREHLLAQLSNVHIRFNIYSWNLMEPKYKVLCFNIIADTGAL